MTSTLVVDASPLIILLKSGLSFVLPELFSNVLLPASVEAEILAGPQDDVAARELSKLAWLQIVSVTDTDPRIDRAVIGNGEAEALSIALGNEEATVLIDDAAARRTVASLGLRYIGTGGLLVLAKRQGLIVSVADALGTAKSKGLWISREIEKRLLESAGEVRS